MKVPGICRAGLLALGAQERQSTAFRRGEAPYLCWFGHGLRFCSGNTVEKKETHECGPLHAFPQFPQPSCLLREAMLLLLLSSCLQPFRFKSTQTCLKTMDRLAWVQTLPPGWERDLELSGRQGMTPEHTPPLGHARHFPTYPTQSSQPSDSPFPPEDKMEDGESGRLHHLPKVTQLKTEFNKVQIP